MSSTSAIIIMHEAELVDPRRHGSRLRAYCLIHGSDHQRSLSIALDGDMAGYGKCHSCQPRVFVPELAPQGARGRSAQPRRPTAETLLRPLRRLAARNPTPAAWQREELAELQRLEPRMRARL